MNTGENENNNLYCELESPEDLEKNINCYEELAEELEDDLDDDFDDETVRVIFENDDIICTYLKEISQYPLLSYAEEQELFKEYNSIDDKQSPEAEAIREKIVNSNLKLVVSVATKIMRKSSKSRFDVNESFLDLIQEGNFGLMKAIDKFEPELGYKFSTYAIWWIKQSIFRYKLNSCRTIRVSINAQSLFLKYKKCKEEYYTLYGQYPTEQKLAIDLNVSLDKIHLFELLVYQDIISLETPIGEEQDSLLSEFVSSENYVENEVLEKITSDELWDFIEEILTPREYEILKYRLGKNESNIYLTLDQIGKIFNITRERVRQIELKAILKMKSKANKKKILSLLDNCKTTY